MKDETGDAAIEEFIRLKPKMYSFLVDDNSEHKKAKGVNRRVFEKINDNEYKDALLNNICIRRSMNRIQSKDNRIKTFNKINKMKSTKFQCLVLMTKYISKTVDIMD